jgi:hypothetical protein
MCDAIRVRFFHKWYIRGMRIKKCILRKDTSGFFLYRHTFISSGIAYEVQWFVVFSIYIFVYNCLIIKCENS